MKIYIRKKKIQVKGKRKQFFSDFSVNDMTKHDECKTKSLYNLKLRNPISWIFINEVWYLKHLNIYILTVWILNFFYVKISDLSCIINYLNPINSERLGNIEETIWKNIKSWLRFAVRNLKRITSLAYAALYFLQLQCNRHLRSSNSSWKDQHWR